jgi:hypothetical protein
MKYLQTLCERADVHLTIKYYCPYLNALEERLLREAVQKQSTLYTLNLLKALSLKILFLLQHSAFLWGELPWQSLINQSQSALAARGDSQQLRMALHQADEVISTAGVTEVVRGKIWSEVKDHALLSDQQAQRYESVRQEYLTRQTALNELESATNTTLRDHHQLIGHSSLFNETIPSFRPLRSYEMKMIQSRLSKENIHHQIQCEGDARLVYQNLTKEFMQKPAAERMAEDVQKAKSRLQHCAEQAAEKTDRYRRQIIQQTRSAIEHRTQVTLAHAHRVENISLSLAAIIFMVQSYCPGHCQPLLNLMVGAQAMQKDLQGNKDGAALQEKLLAMNAHRCTYEKSITSFWGTLFTNRRQLQYQQRFNRNLQIALAHIVTPICGFNDKNKAITSETVKKLKITSDKLALQQEYLTKEQDKINQIKNICIG